jgi:hypothetical protein
MPPAAFSSDEAGDIAMKTIVAAAVLAGLFATGAAAQTASSKGQVVERDAQHHPTKVLIDGQVYPVCTKGVTDGCINPRQAGLNWGDAPLSDWPGAPASQKDPGH